MKKIFLMVLMAICSISMMAQESYFPIRIELEEIGEPFPAAGAKQLGNKLNMMLTQSGIVSFDAQTPFVLTAFVIPQEKTIISGPPSQISETMEFTFYICDMNNQILFATTSQTVKGIGTTEGRCYMDAIKKIQTNSAEIQKFVKDGTAKIVAYYDHEWERILTEVRAKAKAHNYEAAIAQALSFPTTSKHYKEAVALGLQIFQQYQDYVCQTNLQQARSEWAQAQNALGAGAAGEYLAAIYPDAACYKEAQVLYKEIHDKVADDWKFEMKKYQDGVDLEKQRIEAARQVGIEYGKHQPQQMTNFGFLK